MLTERIGQWLGAVSRLDAHHRLFFALVAGAAAFASASPGLPLAAQVAVGWTAFAGVNLLLAWAVIAAGQPAAVRRSAWLQDSGRSLIMTLVVLASCGSLWAVWSLIGLARTHSGAGYALFLTLALLSVAVSWSLVHTIFALRYAHIYYGAGEIHGTHHGGLEFPGNHLPDYMDFAYYAFVVGMTAQVSDVQVTSRRLRRLTLFHGVISFAFNTVILALAVNVIATAALA